MVDKLDIWEIGDFLELVRTKTSPGFAKGDSHIVAVALGRDSLDSVHASGVCEENKLDKAFFAGFTLNGEQVVLPGTRVLNHHELP